MPPAQDPTSLLQEWSGGNSVAMNELVEVLYEQMHRIAAGQLHGERHLTLQPTQLVNEVYLRLVQLREMEWRDRNHFLAMFARIARRALVDEARRRRAGKRAGQAVTLSTQIPLPTVAHVDVLQIDALLDRLATIDSVAARIVELRVFSGLTLEDVAAQLELSVSTVSRKWRAAKAWLAKEMPTDSPDGD